MFICLRRCPLLGFCLGWSSNFVGSESDQIQSSKVLQTMVSNTTQHPPPPTSHTLSVYIYCTLTVGRGGGGEPERRFIVLHLHTQKYTCIVNHHDCGYSELSELCFLLNFYVIGIYMSICAQFASDVTRNIATPHVRNSPFLSSWFQIQSRIFDQDVSLKHCKLLWKIDFVQIGGIISLLLNVLHHKTWFRNSNPVSFWGFSIFNFFLFKGTVAPV